MRWLVFSFLFLALVAKPTDPFKRYKRGTKKAAKKAAKKSEKFEEPTPTKNVPNGQRNTRI